MMKSSGDICYQKNILVVDDKSQNLKLLSGILDSAGYKVRPARSGQLALDAVQTILPDLILLDIMMPDLDGFQVCRELKANPATRDVPVIFISAIGAMSERLQAFEQGGVDFIPKPYQPEEVLARIRLHLQLRDSQLLLQQEIAAHEVARKELKHHQQGLEEVVGHRTLELRAMNQELRREIDSHKSTEKALAESEKRYQAIVDVGFTAIVIHRDQKIVFANPSFCDILKAGFADLNGRNIFEFVPEEEHPLVRSSIRENQQRIIDHHIINSQGRRVPVESVGFESSHEGKPARVVAIRDISDRQNLRETAERTSRLASLGELAAGVAHEINNPNAVIHLIVPVVKKILEDVWPLLKEASVKNPGLSFAGLSCDEVVEMLPQMLTRMQESSDRIGQIVMDLKDFVREQNDKTFTVVDLNQVVRTSCRMMENTIRNSTLSFDFQPEPSPVLFLGDFQRIEQVVVNLIQNACQALTDMRQKIVLRTYFDGNGCASLQITDQGCGISADDLPKITNPFFTTKRSTGGTGLGLSVSVSILQDHAANFDVESTVGHGSSVTISFPAINEENNL